MPDTRPRRWRSSSGIQERARQLRRELTHAEGQLWQRLRRGQLGPWKFRRQYPIGRFIVDFYCPQLKLVIEVDGDTHADRVVYDAERSRWLEEEPRCRMIRFTNDEIEQNLEGVLEAHC